MTLTHYELKILQATFPAKDHKFVEGSRGKMYAYLAEDAIMARVESIDPAAGWSIDGVSVRKDGDTHSVSVWGTLTIMGVSRSGMGSASVSLYSFTKKKTGEAVTGEANEAEKSAATDALKRAARMFGIGRYLLSLPDNVNDVRSLSQWIGSSDESQPDKSAAWQPSDQEWENKILPYLDETFGLNQEHALRALECMQHEPLNKGIQDWMGTRDNALSAWLVYGYEFSQAYIREGAAQLKLSDDILNKALEYMPRMLAYYNETYATPEQTAFDAPMATDTVTYHEAFTELHTTPRVRVYNRDPFRALGIDCEDWVKDKTYGLGVTVIVPATKETSGGNLTTNKLELQF